MSSLIYLIPFWQEDSFSGFPKKAFNISDKALEMKKSQRLDGSGNSLLAYLILPDGEGSRESQ